MKDNPIQVQLFKCDNPSYREYGKWGYKVRYNGVRIEKSRYAYQNREDALRAAKAFVTENFPGCWRDRAGRVSK